jgi:hypothetical protein
LRTKGPKAALKDVFTVRDCDAILKEFGFRPATTEEVATVRDATFGGSFVNANAKTLSKDK